MLTRPFKGGIEQRVPAVVVNWAPAFSSSSTTRCNPQAGQHQGRITRGIARVELMPRCLISSATTLGCSSRPR